MSTRAKITRVTSFLEELHVNNETKENRDSTEITEYKRNQNINKMFLCILAKIKS